MNVVRLRWLAVELGFEKIILKKGRMVTYFINNQESPYYKSTIFSKILGFIQQNPKDIKMKEAKNKLTMSFDHVKNVQNAIEKIQKIDIG
jgi:transcription-repair coupling factor (superfamily II helicase)